MTTRAPAVLKTVAILCQHLCTQAISIFSLPFYFRISQKKSFPKVISVNLLPVELKLNYWLRKSRQIHGPCVKTRCPKTRARVRARSNPLLLLAPSLMWGKCLSLSPWKTVVSNPWLHHILVDTSTPHSPGALAHVWEDGDALKPHLPHLSCGENLCLSSGPWKTWVSIPVLQHGSPLCIMGGKTNCTRAMHLNPTPSHPWCSSICPHCADDKVCVHKMQNVNTQDGFDKICWIGDKVGTRL